MAKQIEGEGLEADVEKVPTVEIEPVEVPVGDNVVERYVLKMDSMIRRSPAERNYAIDEQTVRLLAPHALFDDNQSLVFVNIAINLYLDMLHHTSPRLHRIIVGSDMKDMLPDEVDLGGGTNSGNPLTHFTSYLGLHRDDLQKGASLLGSISDRVYLIPDVGFLSAFFSQPKDFQAYVSSVSSYHLQDPPFFAAYDPKHTAEVLIAKNLPRPDGLFGIGQLEKALANGVGNFGELMKEYDQFFGALSEMNKISWQERKELAIRLKVKRPDLFYDG